MDRVEDFLRAFEAAEANSPSLNLPRDELQRRLQTASSWLSAFTDDERLPGMSDEEWRVFQSCGRRMLQFAEIDGLILPEGHSSREVP